MRLNHVAPNFSDINTDEIAKDLFAQPAMTISDLYDDPGVRLRIAKIVDLATYRNRAAKSPVQRHRRSLFPSDHELPDGNTVGHFKFYGRYG
jgi:hypothetical protein